MTMPTIEDLLEVFRIADLSPQRQGYRTGILAVLDALKPVVAEAYQCGEDDNDPNLKTKRRALDAEDYAARTIAQIVGGSK